jgi:hypothetical protein
MAVIGLSAQAMRAIAGANGSVQAPSPAGRGSIVTSLESDPSEQFAARAMKRPQVFQVRPPVGVRHQVASQAGSVVMGVQQLVDQDNGLFGKQGAGVWSHEPNPQLVADDREPGEAGRSSIPHRASARRPINADASGLSSLAE